MNLYMQAGFSLERLNTFREIVAAGSIAAAAGLKAGDVIVQVARYRVSSLNDFGILLERFPEKGKVRVGVVRNDRVGYAILEF